MPRPLGQHFLKDTSALRKICTAIDPQKGDTIIEVGPGHGELSDTILHSLELLSATTYSFTAIEKDPSLVPALIEKYGSDKNVRIVAGDVRSVLSEVAPKKGPYKIVGNIPYYLTTYLLRIVSELPHKPTLVVFTMQKEVAERICAKPAMNLLAAIMHYWATPSIAGIIPKNSFAPPPKVDSATLVLKLKDSVDWDNADRFFSFVKILFKQPRKTIANNLHDGLDTSKENIEKILTKHSLSSGARPHELTFDEIALLVEENWK